MPLRRGQRQTVDIGEVPYSHPLAALRFAGETSAMRGGATNDDRSSHRHILRATSIVGGATLASLVISLVRNKAVALIGGPEAVGLLGLLAGVMTTAGAIFTFGLDTSAVRQLAPRIADAAASARVRWAIWTLGMPLALAGGAAVWLFRQPLATC